MISMVVQRLVEGDVSFAKKDKIVLLFCPVDNIQTGTKSTIWIKFADELINFSGEKNLLESPIKAVVDTSANKNEGI